MTFACWFINNLLETIYMIIMNKYLKKQLENSIYQTNHVIDIFIKIHKYMTIMSMSLTFLSILTIISYFLSISLIISFIIFLEYIILVAVYYVCAHSKHHNAIKYTTAFSLIVLTLFINQSKAFSIPPVHQTLYSQNQVKDAYLRESKGIFANTKSIDIYSDYYEKYVECLHHDIAEIIFQQEVIIVDRELRREKIIAEHQVTGKIYDENDYPYNSFKDSLKNMKKYQTELVNDCYYNDMYAVCIKDNKVLSFQIQSDNQMIDHILEYYFQ